MADLDDLYARIPTSQIASNLGADEAEVDSAVRTLVPVLLTGLQHGSQDPERAGKIESAANTQAARGLLDAGGGQVAEGDGHEAVATLFGGNDTDQVAAALAKGGAGNGELLKKLLPVLLPIVLAYVGKQLDSRGGGEQTTKAQQPGGSLGEILGGILGKGSGDTSLGGILGDILGGLLGGKK